MKKLCYVATLPAVVHTFLRGHIQAAAERYEVTVICNSTDAGLLEGLRARLILLPIERKPSPWKDLVVFIRLVHLFHREKFNIVHSIMPKSGLLAMAASWLTRTPVRIHTFTGQVWVTKYGVKRKILKWFDKLVGKFAVFVLADSPSQRDFLISKKILSGKKIAVIEGGSICGVNPLRFHPDAMITQAVRSELNIPQTGKVIIYVGRLNRDKGVLDLAMAFNKISGTYSDAYLLLVGAEEDVSFRQLQQICSAAQERLRYINFTRVPERYMAAANIICLPSYREGFGMTIIEAAACGIPAVASQIYGIVDAVEDGETGLLFPAKDVDALTKALVKLISDDGQRLQMGNAARERVLKKFASEKITNGLLKLYERCLKQK